MHLFLSSKWCFVALRYVTKNDVYNTNFVMHPHVTSVQCKERFGQYRMFTSKNYTYEIFDAIRIQKRI